jgi:hypothetical protein
MKFWRDRLPSKSCRLKSYVLESLVYHTIGVPSSHAAAVVNVLQGVESSFGSYRGTNTVPVVPDPGYPAVNVAKHWEVTAFDDFMAQAKPAAATAREALDSNDESESRRLWRQLFGPDFGS